MSAVFNDPYQINASVNNEVCFINKGLCVHCVAAPQFCLNQLIEHLLLPLCQNVVHLNFFNSQRM
jgi:hypothetical protein